MLGCCFLVSFHFLTPTTSPWSRRVVLGDVVHDILQGVRSFRLTSRYPSPAAAADKLAHLLLWRRPNVSSLSVLLTFIKSSVWSFDLFADLTYSHISTSIPSKTTQLCKHHIHQHHPVSNVFYEWELFTFLGLTKVESHGAWGEYGNIEDGEFDFCFRVTVKWGL